MNDKIKKIIGWVISGLLAALLLASAINKLSGGASEVMIDWGFTEHNILLIGVVEIISVVLFLIPKTSPIGTLLLASYLGGAIATHMQQGDPYVFPAIINAVVWIAGIIRNPGILSSFTKD